MRKKIPYFYSNSSAEARYSNTSTTTEIQKSSSSESGFDISPPNGGWGWVITFASFFINVVLVGMHNSYGVLLVSLLDAFQQSLAATALVGSISVAFVLLSAPLSGFLANKLGCRTVAMTGSILAASSLFASTFTPNLSVLYVTYGLGFGVGTSFCYIQGAVMVTRYFTTRKALASGIILAGSSIGALLIVPIYESLQDCLGWKTALRIIAGFALTTLICSATFRPLSKPGAIPLAKRVESSNTDKVINNFQLWKNKAFLVWCLAVGLNKLGYFVPWVHIVKMAEDIGFTRADGSKLILYMGIASTISRLAAGKIADVPWINNQYVAQISTAGMGAANIYYVFARNSTGILVYAVSYGLLDGGIEILLPILTLELVGAQGMSVAWGLILAVTAISAVGPPVVGAIRDSTGSYYWGLYFTGIPMLLAAVVLFLIPCTKQQKPESKAIFKLSDSDYLLSKW